MDSKPPGALKRLWTTLNKPSAKYSLLAITGVSFIASSTLACSMRANIVDNITGAVGFTHRWRSKRGLVLSQTPLCGKGPLRIDTLVGCLAIWQSDCQVARDVEC